MEVITHKCPICSKDFIKKYRPICNNCFENLSGEGKYLLHDKKYGYYKSFSTKGTHPNRKGIGDLICDICHKEYEPKTYYQLLTAEHKICIDCLNKLSGEGKYLLHDKKYGLYKSTSPTGKHPKYSEYQCERCNKKFIGKQYESRCKYHLCNECKKEINLNKKQSICKCEKHGFYSGNQNSLCPKCKTESKKKSVEYFKDLLKLGWVFNEEKMIIYNPNYIEEGKIICKCCGRKFKRIFRASGQIYCKNCAKVHKCVKCNNYFVFQGKHKHDLKAKYCSYYCNSLDTINNINTKRILHTENLKTVPNFIKKDEILMVYNHNKNDYKEWESFKEELKSQEIIDFFTEDGFFTDTYLRDYNDSHAAFEQRLVELGIGYFVYIKFYKDNYGNINPLQVAKSGSKLVNTSGSDLCFSLKKEHGPARRFLLEERLDWFVKQIYIIPCETEQKAYKLESKIMEKYNLFGS